MAETNFEKKYKSARSFFSEEAKSRARRGLKTTKTSAEHLNESDNNLAMLRNKLTNKLDLKGRNGGNIPYFNTEHQRLNCTSAE